MSGKLSESLKEFSRSVLLVLTVVMMVSEDFAVCGSGSRVHRYYWCDGWPHCSDNHADELNCEYWGEGGGGVVVVREGEHGSDGDEAGEGDGTLVMEKGILQGDEGSNNDGKGVDESNGEGRR